MHTHQIGAPSTYTMISADLASFGSATRSQVVELPNAIAAQKFQEENVDKLGRPYDIKTRSCVTHVGEVLRAGGVAIPAEPGAQFKFLKKRGL